MRDLFSFLWETCWRGRGLIGRAVQLISITIPSAAAVVISGWERSDWPLGVWGALLVAGLFLALFISVFREAYRAWLDRRPKVTISPDCLVDPKGATGRAFRRMRLRIENQSTRHLKNCTLREDDFLNRHGHRSGLQRYFRLAEESHADMRSHSFSKLFDLRGRGATQIIDIAALDETDENGRVFLLYATTPTSQTLNACPRSTFPHILIVSFTCDDMTIAEKKAYNLFISADGLLEMTEVALLGSDVPRQ